MNQTKKNDFTLKDITALWKQSGRDAKKFVDLMEEKQPHIEPAADFSPAQEEAPATGPVGASKTPTWNDVLEKLHQLEARLTALERET